MSVFPVPLSTRRRARASTARHFDSCMQISAPLVRRSMCLVHLVPHVILLTRMNTGSVHVVPAVHVHSVNLLTCVCAYMYPYTRDSEHLVFWSGTWTTWTEVKKSKSYQVLLVLIELDQDWDMVPK